MSIDVFNDSTERAFSAIRVGGNDKGRHKWFALGSFFLLPSCVPHYFRKRPWAPPIRCRGGTRGSQGLPRGPGERQRDGKGCHGVFGVEKWGVGCDTWDLGEWLGGEPLTKPMMTRRGGTPNQNP